MKGASVVLLFSVLCASAAGASDPPTGNPDLDILSGVISNIDLNQNTFQLEGKTYTASPSNTVGAKLYELKEGDKVHLQSEDTTAGKEPYNVMMLKKVE